MKSDSYLKSETELKYKRQRRMFACCRSMRSCEILNQNEKKKDRKDSIG